jgi:hypothetical protein
MPEINENKSVTPYPIDNNSILNEIKYLWIEKIVRN